MDDPQGVVRTALIDLTQVQFATLRDCDWRFLALSTERLLQQIMRPRVNFGGGSPPARVD
jgi:hypothetical protein